MKTSEELAATILDEEYLPLDDLILAGVVKPQKKGMVKSLRVGGLGSSVVDMEVKYLVCHRMITGKMDPAAGFSMTDVGGLNGLRRFMVHFGDQIQSLSDICESDLKTWSSFAEYEYEQGRVPIKAVEYLPLLVKDAQHLQIDFRSASRTEVEERLSRLLGVSLAWQRFDDGDESDYILNADSWREDQIAKLRGTRRNESSPVVTISFLGIADLSYRDVAKEFVRDRFMGGKRIEPKTADRYSVELTHFLNFVSMNTSHGLKGLGRTDVEAYLVARELVSVGKASMTNTAVGIVRSFLEWLQQSENVLAPQKYAYTLIGSSDYKKAEPTAHPDEKQTPRYILECFASHWDEIDKDIKLLLLILLKTGLRISDVLQLPAKCLSLEKDGWWIVFDVQKIRTYKHRVPIDEELAEQIKVFSSSDLCANAETNPRGFLFVSPNPARKGGPLRRDEMVSRINKLLELFGLTANGEDIISFRFHGMRHRYAMSVLNAGGDIVALMDILGHVSPSMTNVYAHLTDSRKREVFDAAIADGVFTFVENDVEKTLAGSDVSPAFLDALWVNAKLTAKSTPYGVCTARKGKACPLAAEPPCLTASAGKPCPYLSVGLSEMDTPKYEAFLEAAVELIEIGERYGNVEMVESAEKDRRLYENILTRLKTGGVIIGADLLFPEFREDGVDNEVSVLKAGFIEDNSSDLTEL